LNHTSSERWQGSIDEAEIVLPVGKKYINATFIPDFGSGGQVKGTHSLIAINSDRKQGRSKALQARSRTA